MSLTLRKVDNGVPYNDTNIRWKRVALMLPSRKIRSFYFNQLWKLGVNHVSHTKWTHGLGVWNGGFHVYVNKPDTQDDCEDTLLIKVQVSGFIASGHFGTLESETWRRAKMVAIYNNKGKNITYRFRPKKKLDAIGKMQASDAKKGLFHMSYFVKRKKKQCA